jgi:hypothetical protein
VKFLTYKLLLLLFGVAVFVPASFGANLSGSISVNETSDTAANAKINAVNSARRQILSGVLSQYSNKDALNELIKNTSNDDLMNLISSSSVANEQMSSNSYSAKITMNIDNDVTKKWLTENNVQNWIPFAENSERFTVLMVVSNGIQDWAELKRVVRDDNIEIETQSIVGNQIVAKMPLTYRTKFTAAVKNAGWKFADNGGVLQIWK